MGAIPYKGVSHLALVSSDMAKTVEFYEGVLGMPLMKTMDLADLGLPGGGQHFFFDCGNGDCLAFFWYGYGVEAARGVAAPRGMALPSADGSMHHVAFKIEPEEVMDTKRVLDDKGVEYQFIVHQLPEVIMPRLTPEVRAQMEERGLPEKLPSASPDDIDESTFAVSFYMEDPDGIQVEICAWYPAWDKIVREHQPAANADRTKLLQPV
jgi:catechol 2,3-dioxygenase-like lactoylglutathione lyase family enzyme